MTEAVPSGERGSSGEPIDPEDARPASDDPAAASFADAVAAAARGSALGRVAPGEAPTGRALLQAMGGVRGLAESIVPGVLFVVIYTVTTSVPWSVGVPGVLALVFVAVRLVQRQSVTLSVAGVFGVLISAILAIVTGRAANNFLLGFVIDAALFLVMTISLLVRRPLIGLLIGAITGDAAAWRTDPRRRRVATIATLLWAAFPLARLIVQVPLYLGDLTTALGTTKLLMGVPLYAGVVWVTWLLVRAVLAPTAEASDDSADRV